MSLLASDVARVRSGHRLLARLWTIDLVEACGFAFAAIAVSTAALAFVGLAASNFWIDELFTLFLIDHHGGPAEVVRRALTDTHPPAYYLLLNAWLSVAGAGEVALRAPSAAFAVAAVGVFALVARRAFSVPAVAFACALATTSPFWFFQAQNARNYALCMLLSALLMAGAAAARARAAQGRSTAPAIGALLAVGALAAFSHFYGLLTTGFVIGWLLLTLPSWRARTGLVAGGLAILAADVAYIRLLTAHTQQNLQEMWFRNDTAHLLGVVREVLRSAVASSVQSGVLLLILVVALAGLLRRPAPLAEDGASEPRAATRRWLLRGAWMTLLGVYLTGLAISLIFAPSLSDQNVLVAAPFLWLLWAGLFERAFVLLGPRVRPWIAVLLVALLAGQVTMAWRGRPLPRNETWRASADYVAALPACAGAAIPVVRPYKFGPDTPFFRDLTRRDFFGRFLADRPLLVRSPAAFMVPDADPALVRLLAARANDPAACPVLAWAVHDFGLSDARALRRGVANLPGVAPGVVRLRVFSHYRRDGLGWTRQPSAYVLELCVEPAPAVLIGLAAAIGLFAGAVAEPDSGPAGLGFTAWAEKCRLQSMGLSPEAWTRRGDAERISAGRYVEPAPINCVLAAYRPTALTRWAEAGDPVALLAVSYLALSEAEAPCSLLPRVRRDLGRAYRAPRSAFALERSPTGDVPPARVPEAAVLLAQVEAACGRPEEAARSLAEAQARGFDIRAIRLEVED